MLRRYYKVMMAGLMAMQIATQPVYAADPEMESPEAQLARLDKALQSDPDNLDLLFEYGQAAIKLEKYEDAERVFLAMLSRRGDLERVKLDLGLVYLRMGRFEDARRMFEEVLATNPPESVQQNIKAVLARVEDAMKKHRFSGSVSIGVNRDTNANSVSGSGSVLFADITLPLDPSSQAKPDTQLFAAVSLNHAYQMGRPREGGAHFWVTDASIYQAEQISLDTLDLRLYTLHTGPTIQLEGIPGRINMGFGYNYVELYRREYMNIKSLDLGYSHNLSPQLQLQTQVMVEDRDFINSPSVSTYDDRTGNANQVKIGLNYAVTPDSMLNLSVILRRENTRQGYYDNEQIALNGAYTQMLPWDMFGSLALLYRKTDYDEVDPFVSSSTFRNDREKSLTVTLGKQLPYNLVWSLSYQQRHVDSSIRNYDYMNKRVSTALAWRF